MATLLAVGGLAIAGCGDEESSSASLANVLSYFPADAGSVTVVSTDLESDQVEALDETVGRRLLGERLEVILQSLIEEGDEPEDGAEDGEEVSFDDDVEPLLGGPLAVGTRHPSGLAAGVVTGAPDSEFLAVLETRDGDRARAVVQELLGLERAGEHNGATLYEEAGDPRPLVAVDGDTLLYADDPAVLRDALDQPGRGDGLRPERFEAALEGLPDDALVRGYGNLRGLLAVPKLARFREIPWAAALRTLGFTASFDRDAMTLDARVATDPTAIEEDDLPLPPGAQAPEVVRGEGRISGASRDQSQTTVFLLRAVRAAYPESRFVRDVARLERTLGIDFEREILQQFNGPSASLLAPDGSFAARSEVRDPAFIARRMRELAPDLGRLIQDLEGLGSRGMALLLLFAPDAPVSPVLGSSRVKVEEVRRDFYRVSGLTGDGPPVLFFGLVDGVFVVASDERRAQAIARAEAAPLEGMSGASVMSADAATLADLLLDFVDFEGGELGEATGSLSASLESLRGTLRIEFP